MSGRLYLMPELFGQYPDEVVFTSSREKWFMLSIPFALIFACGIYTANAGEPTIGGLMCLFSGLLLAGTLTAAFMPATLTLTPQGMQQNILNQTLNHDWRLVHNFRVRKIVTAYYPWVFECLDFDVSNIPPSWADRENHTLVYNKTNLRASYETAEDLLQFIKRYQASALSEIDDET